MTKLTALETLSLVIVARRTVARTILPANHVLNGFRLLILERRPDRMLDLGLRAIKVDPQRPRTQKTPDHDVAQPPCDICRTCILLDPTLLKATTRISGAHPAKSHTIIQSAFYFS